MPPPPPEIYWSAKSRRFYSGKSGQFVSREQAIKTLEYDAERNRFVDLRGRSVPVEALRMSARSLTRGLGRDRIGRPFLQTEFTDRRVTEQVAKQYRYKPDEQVNCRYVVKTDDGKVHSIPFSGKMGKQVNMEDFKRRARGHARKYLEDKGYKIDSPTLKRITVHLDFAIRRVKVVKVR